MDRWIEFFGQWTFGWVILITIAAFITLTFIGRWGRMANAAWNGDERPREGSLKIRIPGAVVLGIAVGGYFQAAHDDWKGCIDAESQIGCTYERFAVNPFQDRSDSKPIDN